MLPLAFSCCTGKPEVDPLEAKVDEICAKMTLEEKVSQLYGVAPWEIMENGKLSLEKCREKMPYGVGHICQYACNLDVSTEELTQFVNDVQSYLVNETSTGIPAVFQDEAITGIAAKGATVYPQQIGVASTWNPSLAYQKTVQTGETMRAIGCRLALSPMVDVIRTAHWPRIEESYGEDGYLSAVMGSAFVGGLQSKGLKDGVAATTKHFLGYGGACNLPWKELYEEVILPHEVIIRQVGSKSIMTCYDHFRSEWAVSSDTLLNTVLRDYMQYDGTVISDYYAVTHARASEEEEFLKQCAADAINAGNDVELPDNATYRYLIDLVKEGRVTEETITKACKRSLMMKARLGLLDPNPVYTAEGHIEMDPAEHRQTAYELAAQSVVMLKNNGILPLAAGKKIALVGPNANTYWCMLGDYTFQSMQAFWQSNIVDPSCLEIKSLLEAMTSRVDGTVNYQRGCDWSSPNEVKIAQSGDPRAAALTGKLMESADPTDWRAALALARKSDVIVAALGENPALCGENRVRKGIRLPGDQEKFLKDLIATGKPVILVMFGGRPQVITNVADGCAAILQAWYPGEEGANAVADILSGKVNPSGKLPVSYPATESTEMYCYNNDVDPEFAAYPFGFGLSYTEYEYSDIKVQSAAKTSDEWIEVSCKVKNAGERAGAEVAQLYVSPASGQPLKPLQLKGFARVDLQPGETKTVRFQVAADQLAWWSKEAGWTISAGDYRFRIGPSSAVLPLEGICSVSGDAIVKALRTNYLCKVSE